MIKATPCGKHNKYTDKFDSFSVALWLLVYCCKFSFFFVVLVCSTPLDVYRIRIQMPLIPLFGFVFRPLNYTAREQPNKSTIESIWIKAKCFCRTRELTHECTFFIFLSHTRSKWMICSIFDDNNRVCMVYQNKPHIIIKKFGYSSFFWSTHT